MNSLVMLGHQRGLWLLGGPTFAPAVLPVGMDNIYYEPGAVIVTLILLGRFSRPGKGPYR